MAGSFYLHFVHGSRPLKKYRKSEAKLPGGFFGGHIYIQSGETVYGFEPVDRSRIHLFPQKKINGFFRKEDMRDWRTSINDQKMTSIEVSADEAKIAFLNNLLESYAVKTPYDYAVFGMRCGSSTYQILSMLGYFTCTSRFSAIVRIPVPKILRKKMVRTAAANKYRIKTQDGNMKRKWE